MKYRLFFIAILSLITWVLLWPIQHALKDVQYNTSNQLHLQNTYLLWMLVNTVVALYLGKEKGIELMGQISMLSILAVLFSLPLLLLQHNTMITHLNVGIWLGAFCTLMLKAYIQRMRYCSNRVKRAAIIYFVPLLIGLLMGLFM